MRLPARLAVLALIAVAPLPLLAAPVVAQKPADQPAIQFVGRTPASDTYTFAARLEQRSASRLICSGWVYDPWTIVTGAHCVTPLPSTGPTAPPLSTTAITAHVSRSGRPGGCGEAPQILVTPSTHRDWMAHQAARNALLLHPTDLAAR